MRAPVLALAVSVALAAIAVVCWRTGASSPTAPPSPGESSTIAPARAPRPAPATTGAALPLAGAAADTGGAPAATDRRRAPPPQAEPTAEALAFLERARDDRTLAVLVAEVLAVGPVEVAAYSADALQRQDVRLRLLAGEFGGSLRRHATVSAALCPAASEKAFGCSTPFGGVAPGQVRQVVLASGRPDVRGFAALLGTAAQWLVVAGPEQARPDDPLLASIPPSILPFLGRPMGYVFRGRVRELNRRGEGRDSNPLRDADRIVVEVAAVASSGPLQLGRTVRIGQAPFTAGLDLTALVVGAEYWFATDEAGALWHVLRAFAPLL